MCIILNKFWFAPVGSLLFTVIDCHSIVRFGGRRRTYIRDIVDSEKIEKPF